MQSTVYSLPAIAVLDSLARRKTSRAALICYITPLLTAMRGVIRNGLNPKTLLRPGLSFGLPPHGKKSERRGCGCCSARAHDVPWLQVLLAPLTCRVSQRVPHGIYSRSSVCVRSAFYLSGRNPCQCMIFERKPGQSSTNCHH